MTSDFVARPDGFSGGLGPGSRIAGYVIEEQVGAGGMAVVFRSRDELLGRLAAVKVIAPALAGDPQFRARFLRESKAAAAVDSPHIVPVYGAGEADGLLYIATRFVAGGDLAALLRRSGGRLAPARAASLVAQVALALDAAHAAGLVHRDVKPQNVLVDAAPEHAYLADFGLSKGSQPGTGVTASGVFLGTPDYSAPEQIRGDPVDGRTDQYALACVAFVLLTGTLPFRRDETMATMYAHVHDPVPLVTELGTGLPPAVDAVIARALAKSPADRYARCGEFSAALQQALAGPQRLPGSPLRGRQATTDGPRPAGAQGRAFTAHIAAGQRSTGSGDTTAAGGSARTTRSAATSDRTRNPRRRHRRTTVIAGAAVLAVAAAGVTYSLYSPNGSPSSPKRPSSPILAATWTVPDGGAVGSVWFSPDGKLVAAAATAGADQSKIYVWNTVSRSYVTTITAPDVTIDKSVFGAAIDNVAFSSDDASLTAAVYANQPGNIDPDNDPDIVYRWDLATGERTTVGSIVPHAGYSVNFSGDNTAVDITRPGGTDFGVETLGPDGRSSTFSLPGGYFPFSMMDQNGTRVVLDDYNDTGSGETTYVWDVAQKQIVAEVHLNSGISAGTVISPDGNTILACPHTSVETRCVYLMWDVATNSNVTPSDPRWRQRWGLASFSVDGSVVATIREGGKIDLWNVTTRQYLLTVSYPGYLSDSHYAAVGPGGSNLVILGSNVSGSSEYRQLDLWDTPLNP